MPGRYFEFLHMHVLLSNYAAAIAISTWHPPFLHSAGSSAIAAGRYPVQGCPMRTLFLLVYSVVQNTFLKAACRVEGDNNSSIYLRRDLPPLCVITKPVPTPNG